MHFIGDLVKSRNDSVGIAVQTFLAIVQHRLQIDDIKKCVDIVGTYTVILLCIGYIVAQ